MQLIFPIGDVPLSTVQGVSDYWVRLPRGSKPIRNIYTTATPTVTDGRGVLMESLKIADSQVLNACEVAWAVDVDADITIAADPVDFKVGANSLQFTIAAGAAAADTASVAAAFNVTNFTHLEFWLKSNIDLVAGALTLILGLTKGATPVASCLSPAMVAGVWKHCRVPLVFTLIGYAANCTHLTLNYTVDVGACIIHLDDVKAVTLARSVEALKVDQFIEDDVYFALSAGLENDDCKTNRVLTVYYESPEEESRCSN